MYSVHEERLHVLTHGAGFLIALAGVALLLFRAGTPAWPAVLPYGLALLAMYAASSFYHNARDEARKRLLRRLDHCAIYLLIAGTYTPLMLLAVRSTMGYWILGAEWVLAGIGICVKCFTLKSFRGLSETLYLAMGWLCVLCFPALLAGLSRTALFFLIGGGVAYTLGVIFYAFKRPYSHAVWHLFVLAGSSLQYVSVYLLVSQRLA